MAKSASNYTSKFPPRLSRRIGLKVKKQYFKNSLTNHLIWISFAEGAAKCAAESAAEDAAKRAAEGAA